MQLNVLFDYQIFFHQEYGGISRYVIELARRLGMHRDTAVNIYAGRHHNAHLDEAAGTLQVHGRRVPRHPRRLLRALGLLGNAAQFFGHASRAAATHIHQTYYYDLLPPLGRATRILTVYDMTHELFPQHFAAAGRTTRAKRRAVARADHVICISESTRDDLIRLFDVPPAKVTAIPLGLSSTLAAYTGGRAPVDRVHPRPYALFVGQRSGYKNFEALVSAWAATPAVRDHLDLLCFGGGPLAPSEIERLTAAGLAHRVHQVGGSDAVLAAAYAQAEFHIYPSLYEGFGFPPLEAMALGCAVACSDTSSMPEVVGDAALMFDPRSVDAIAGALDRLAGDASLRRALRAAGIERAATFTWQRCADRTRELYLQTC